MAKKDTPKKDTQDQIIDWLESVGAGQDILNHRLPAPRKRNATGQQSNSQPLIELDEVKRILADTVKEYHEKAQQEFNDTLCSEITSVSHKLEALAADVNVKINSKVEESVLQQHKTSLEDLISDVSNLLKQKADQQSLQGALSKIDASNKNLQDAKDTISEQLTITSKNVQKKIEAEHKFINASHKQILDQLPKQPSILALRKECDFLTQDLNKLREENTELKKQLIEYKSNLGKEYKKSNQAISSHQAIVNSKVKAIELSYKKTNAAFEGLEIKANRVITTAIKMDQMDDIKKQQEFFIDKINLMTQQMKALFLTKDEMHAHSKQFDHLTAEFKAMQADFELNAATQKQNLQARYDKVLQKYEEASDFYNLCVEGYFAGGSNAPAKKNKSEATESDDSNEVIGKDEDVALYQRPSYISLDSNDLSKLSKLPQGKIDESKASSTLGRIPAPMLDPKKK